MKKYIQILTSLMLILCIGAMTSNTFAQTPKGGSGVTMYVTEPVPGAKCKCVYRDDKGKIHDNTLLGLKCKGGITKRLYECSIPEGTAGFQDIFNTIVQWIMILATLLGVLALVALGITWAVTGGSDSTAKKFLKEWIQNIIIGLLILYTFGFILRFLASWVFTT